MRMRHLLPLLLIALLAGCATHSGNERVTGENQNAWRTHKSEISQLDGWQIEGKLGIRSEQNSGSGTLFWLQRQSYYDIRIAGPLGQGASRLTGRSGPGGQVTLEVANQGRYEADSPERLLLEQTGLNLPVSNLLWWVRGLPVPDSRSDIELDPQGRLLTLAQDGWQLEYDRYATHNGYDLPERIKLQGYDMDITLVIKSWQPRILGQ